MTYMKPLIDRRNIENLKKFSISIQNQMTYRKLSQICYTLNLLMKHDEETNHHIWPFRKQIAQEIFAICKVTEVALNYLMGVQITQSLQILFTTP